MNTTRQLIVDFGEVVSYGQRPGVMKELADLFDMPEEEFASSYWRHRPAYDAGLDATGYWVAVTGHPCSSTETVSHATNLDVAAWTRLNQDTLNVLRSVRDAGVGLTLLSNAPETQAAHVERLPEIRGLFDRMTFSARIGIVKPDPGIYTVIDDMLPADTVSVVFVDDRQENLDAAAPLGWTGIRFESAPQLCSALDTLAYHHAGGSVYP